MKSYTLKRDAFALGGGEKHEDFGYSYQAYVEEADIPIKFSSHKKGFLEGAKVVAETATVKKFKSGKHEGEDYLWLTKVNLLDDSGSGGEAVQTPSSPSTQAQPKAAAAGWKPKDETQITRNMVWKNLLGHAGVPTTEAEVKTFMELVDLHTKYLLTPPQTPEQKHKEGVKKAVSGYEKARSKANELKGEEPDWMAGLEEEYNE